MKIYVAYFVVEVTSQWFKPHSEEVIKEKKEYCIELQMFTALNADEAYKKASKWIKGFDDSTHDGDGVK